MISLEKEQKISIYKSALSLLKHYDATYQEVRKLEKFIDSCPKEPDYKALPEKPDLKEPKNSHGIAILIAGILIGIAFIGVFGFYLIPNGMYIPKRILYTYGKYTITEVFFIGVTIMIISAVIGIMSEVVHSVRLNKYSKAIVEYEEEVNLTKQENAKIQLNFKRKNEQVKMAELKIQSLKTTMKHLQDEYMKNYAASIPVEIASIDGLEKAINESQQLGYK